MRMTRRLALAACGAALAGCTAHAAPRPAKPKTLPVGIYGASTAALQVTADAATIEFTCAQGTLPVPIVLDAKGAFDVAGTWTQGSGVEPPAPYPAQPTRYAGTFDGKRLSLRATLPDGTALGPFALVPGNENPVAKCMATRPRRGGE